MASKLNITVVGDRLYLGGYGNYLPANELTLQNQIESFRYCLVAVYSWYLWEHIVTLPIEISRWKQLIFKRQIVLVNFCVLLSRYMLWTNAISSAIFFFSNPFSCQATFTWIFFTYGIIWALTAMIFVVRVQGLYPGRSKLHKFVWFVWGVVCCLWIISLGFFYSDRLPEQYWQPRIPQCTAAPAPYVHVLGFGGSMLFDVMILSLTVYSATNNFASRRSRHGIMSAQVWVLETAIVYAFVCFACNASTFFVWIFQKNVLLRAYTVPFAVIINPVVASRIVFHGATWGSKTVLLESTLVKITGDDVANWQRDPGVMGATPSSRRPSHTTIMLPQKGNRYAKPMGNSSSIDTKAFEVEDERLGFDGLFITQAGNLSKKVEFDEVNGTPDSIDDSDLEKGSQRDSTTSFRHPFSNIMAPQRAVRKPSSGIRTKIRDDKNGRISPNIKSNKEISSQNSIPLEEVSPTSSTSPNSKPIPPTSRSSTDIISPFRRGSADANSIASITGNDYDTVEETIDPPQGWTIQEMLRDDALSPSLDNQQTHETSYRGTTYTGPSPLSTRDTELSRGPSYEQSRSSVDQTNDRITISQHVTTRVD